MIARHVHHRFTLRPRAGLAATLLLVAGLAGSAGLAVLDGPFIERANAGSATGRSDGPTTVDQTPHRANGDVSAPRAMKSTTQVIKAEGGSAHVDPKDHRPGALRQGG